MKHSNPRRVSDFVNLYLAAGWTERKRSATSHRFLRSPCGHLTQTFPASAGRSNRCEGRKLKNMLAQAKRDGVL